MNIKEIIDAERWQLVGGFDTEVKRHNASLDRIESAVKERVTEMLWESNTLTVEACKHRIAEIEAQLSRPKGLEDMAKLIIDWLYENGTPHTKVIIDQTSIEVVDGRMGIPIKPRD